MIDVSKTIEKVVDSNLENKDGKYKLIINLDNGISYNTRKCAIALAEAAIRNNEKHLHGENLNKEELSEKIKNLLMTKIPDKELSINNLSVSLVKENSMIR